MITPETLKDHVNGVATQADSPHGQPNVAAALRKLLSNIPEKVDFRALAFPEEAAEIEERDHLSNYLIARPKKGTTEERNEKNERMQRLTKRIESRKVTDQHRIVIAIEIILDTADENGWGLCMHQGYYYVYTGTHWIRVDEPELKNFIAEAAERMGIAKLKSRYYEFKDKLFKQFATSAHLPAPEYDPDIVLINLANGTFEITPKYQELRPPKAIDFLTYQLKFRYDSKATAPQFHKYLEEVLPDEESRKVLAEFMGYLFTRGMKLEKVLFLFGAGRNGKSVLFEIIRAMLGDDNITYYSLSNLTDDSGYYRAKLSGKLVNWASDIGDRLQSNTFKQLASGEPIEARLPYRDPFMLTNVCKFAFNTNQLPADVEHTAAYFERFLIIPFNVYIKPENRDPDLPKKIINSELPGVFNWVLDGLSRLLQQGGFSRCEASNTALETYKKEADSVAMFVDERNFKPHPDIYKGSQEVYQSYKAYCYDEGLRPLARKNFNKRMNGLGFFDQRKEIGRVFYLTVGG
ncbi:MAG: phage/plasmid primase, P4 family [Cyclobacteriaceae bacterium]|nr:phage/plasmid primase, P4 family [Cyclobacteriaceae bacterium]